MKPRFAATSWSETSSLTRAQGNLALSFKRRGPATVLDHLYQQGCAKARFPKTEHGAFTTAVTLNTSGGLTGGDRLTTTVDWGTGAQATVAAQGAERGYRSIEGTAMLRTRLCVEAGAQAEWLPQETILFDGAALHRDLQVDIAADGWFLGVESVVFGRTARGESVQRGTFRDAWRVRRDGRLIYADVTALAGDMQAMLDRQAMGQGARAASTIIHVAPMPPIDWIACARPSTAPACGAPAPGTACSPSAWLRPPAPICAPWWCARSLPCATAAPCRGCGRFDDAATPHR
ncbi:urease accessory protein [Oleomonas cavernae]|uniref:Urease accessory protein UreD n=1 Tax=Oleomonas cavernae TaxID=2320859 RepID=A0A418WIB0_9PROT|nr:urease accessory protein UreD [Oleomonas cavernae]RJF89735.1 urease accessory protein [Oleomonas cavernae]